MESIKKILSWLPGWFIAILGDLGEIDLSLDDMHF